MIRRALKVALQDNLVFRNVTAAVQPPAVRRTEMLTMTADQAGRLLKVASGGRWEALLRLALSTGMRQGEILGLRWSDMNLEGGWLQVRQQLTRDGSSAEPKTAQSRRRIHLGRPLVAALREHRTRQLQERLVLGADWQDHDPVFPAWNGRPLGVSTLIGNYKQLLATAGLPDLRFHDLRRSAASLMLRENVPAKVVQERLGHSSIVMTLDVYGHLSEGMDWDAAERIDALLG